MQQFDVVENLNPISRSRYPFALLLQHSRVSSTGTLVVAPLTVSNPALGRTRLHPAVSISGRPHVVLIEELAAVQRRLLGRVVVSAEPNRYAIIAALDLLFTGI
jgi:toxin CcdB